MGIFDFLPKPTEEEKDPNGIPYSIAKNRPDKSYPYFMTLVSWDELTIEYEKKYIESLGIYHELAIEPKLPKGYEMYPHSSWDELNQKFKKALKETKQFEQKKKIFEEMEEFVNKYGEFRFLSIVNEASGHHYGGDDFWEWYENQIE